MEDKTKAVEESPYNGHRNRGVSDNTSSSPDKAGGTGE